MYKEIDENKRKTIFLMVIFLIIVSMLGYIFGILYGNDGSLGLGLALIFSILMIAGSYFGGDKLALSTSGARPIQKAQNPYVYRLVENLCITAGIPMPKIYIIPDRSMNAFATGRDPEHASIALTTGIIEGLQNEELEGVIAHELSHIKNYDIRVMMIVIVLIGMVGLLSHWILRGAFFQRRGNNDDRSNSPLLFIGLILALFAPIFGQLLRFSISRKREYLADASGALLTRYPDGLASALEKIKYQNTPLRQANSATAHLYISNPFRGATTKIAGLFSTHPPLEDRIKKLRSMNM